MKLSSLLILASITQGSGAIIASSETFGSGQNQFTMDFVEIGDPGNDPENRGYGDVSYRYRMGVYEVSRSMITTYNSLSGGPSLSMADMSLRGGNRPQMPATGLTWNEAARFVNWLNTSQGHSPAYRFVGSLPNENIRLWEAGQVGFDPNNPYRNSQAHYFLPTYDEWFKSAFYNPETKSYNTYATGGDILPLPVSGGTAPGTVVYGQPILAGPADINNAGGLSSYGTMAQNGNVLEWSETNIVNPPFDPTLARVHPSDDWSTSAVGLPSQSGRGGSPPTFQSLYVGLRIAAVATIPEPHTCLFALTGIGFLSLFRRRSPVSPSAKQMT